MELYFAVEDGGVAVSDSGGKRHGVLLVTATRPGNDAFYLPRTLPAVSAERLGGGWRLVFHGEGVVVEIALKQSALLHTGNFSARGRGKAVVRLVWQPPEGGYYPFVPSFMYGCNDGGNSPGATYPRLVRAEDLRFERPWAAEEWLARADRSSHGFTSYIGADSSYMLGISDVCTAGGAVCEKNGLGIAHPSAGRLSVSLGFANVPYTYSAVPGRNAFGRTEGYADLDKGACADIFLAAFVSEGIHGSANRALRAVYALRRGRAVCGGTAGDAVAAVADALCLYGYDPAARNFRVTMRKEQDTAAANLYNTAWSGGLRAAWPLLSAGLLLRNENWAATARGVLHNVADHALNPRSLLLYENYDAASGEWNTAGWWRRMLEAPGHSAYVNGQACWCLLAAWQAEAAAGRRHGNWLNTALCVLDTACRTQAPDGRFGYTYSEADGSMLDGAGFSGCWFVPALALAHRVTGDSRYLHAARRAMAFYAGHIGRFDAWGGPHDIFKSPDEEGVLAFIKAARLLHAATAEPAYLDMLVHGLEYEFSWRFAYDVHNEREPLKSRGWRSTGGSVTSVNNPHVHPMGSAIIADIAYAAEQTGDAYFRERLEDALAWTLEAYLHSDGDYGWGRRGMINERFCHTDALLNERYPDGAPASTWFCAHAWASGAVLEGLTELMGMKGLPDI